LGRPLPDVKFCQLNVSQCDVSETSGRFVVNIYNSLARHVDKYVRIPVAGGDSYQVLDPDGMLYRITAWNSSRLLTLSYVFDCV
jgi:lysosomal alpha-mannosidase